MLVLAATPGCRACDAGWGYGLCRGSVSKAATEIALGFGTMLTRACRHGHGTGSTKATVWLHSCCHLYHRGSRARQRQFLSLSLRQGGQIGGRCMTAVDKMQLRLRALWVPSMLWKCLARCASGSCTEPDLRQREFVLSSRLVGPARRLAIVGTATSTPGLRSGRGVGRRVADAGADAQGDCWSGQNNGQDARVARVELLWRQCSDSVEKLLTNRFISSILRTTYLQESTR